MSAQNVTLASPKSGAKIYYTVDGSTPTTNSSVYSKPIAVAAKTTITAMAAGVSGYSNSSAAAQTYAIIPTTPYISPASGTYTSGVSVNISDATPGTTIYYTTDGSAPTTSSPVYKGPISIPCSPVTETVRAFAVLSGVYGSATSSTYTITPTLPLPVMNPPGGNFTSPTTVTVTAGAPGATIYYTLDNSTPTTSSAKYTGPMQFAQNTSIKVMSVAPKYTPSSVVHNVYAFLVPTPVISPASGTFSTNQVVSISEPLAGATVFYTTDGSTPTTSSPRYTGPFSFAPGVTGTETVQALATASGYQPSAIGTAKITLSLPSGIIATAVTTSAPSQPIATNFLGFSHEWGVAQSLMGTAAAGENAIYRTLINNLTSHMHGPLVIRVGGNSTDTSGTVTSSTVEPFIELAQNEKANFILGVNLGSNNLSLAEEQATTFASSFPGSALMALEIGNEPDGYSSNGLRSPTYSYADFLPQYQEWRQGVAGSTKSPVPVAGPVFGTGNWITSAQPDVASSALKANIFTQHKYVACYNANAPLASNILLQPSSSTGSLYLFQPYAAAAHKAGSAFRIAELNSVCNGGQMGVSNTFSSALWAIDTMFEYASIGVDGVNWNTNYNGGPYDLFQFNTWTKNGVTDYSLDAVRPDYYGLLFFAEAAGNTARLLSTTTLTNSNIKIWVTTDSSGDAHLVIINKETSTSGKVQITLPGYTQGTIIRLLASSYQATNGVTIGGQTFDGSTDGTLQGSPWTDSTTPINNVWTISVDPMSAVLVNLAP